MYHFWESVKISFKILRENKLRSLLTLLGILIGVTTIIFVHSVLKGAEDYILKEISSMGSNTLYITKHTWMGGDWMTERKRKPLRIKDAQFIENNSAMSAYVAPMLYSTVKIKYRKETLNDVMVTGSNENYEYTSENMPEEGRYFTAEEVRRKTNVAVIGYEIKTTLFGIENPLGRNIFINGKKFTVIGLLTKKGEIFGNNMDKTLVIPIGTLKKYFPYRKRRGIDIAVQVKDPQKMAQTKEELESLIRISRGLKPGKKNDFSINQMSQILEMYNKVTGSLQIVILIIGSLSLFIGGIGIMNIMLVSVTERTKEIGIRKSLGATRRIVMLQFLIEAIILCSFGGILGIICGFSIAQIVSNYTPMPSSISLFSVMLGIGFSTFIGVAFGIYPASKASKLNPIDALRYE